MARLLILTALRDLPQDIHRRIFDVLDLPKRADLERILMMQNCGTLAFSYLDDALVGFAHDGLGRIKFRNLSAKRVNWILMRCRALRLTAKKADVGNTGKFKVTVTKCDGCWTLPAPPEPQFWEGTQYMCGLCGQPNSFPIARSDGSRIRCINCSLVQLGWGLNGLEIGAFERMGGYEDFLAVDRNEIDGLFHIPFDFQPRMADVHGNFPRFGFIQPVDGPYQANAQYRQMSDTKGQSEAIYAGKHRSFMDKVQPKGEQRRLKFKSKGTKQHR